MPKLTDYVVFKDSALASQYASGSEVIPMSTLFEAYFEGKLDIPGDIYQFLDNREGLVKFTLTPDHFKFFFTRMIPEVAIHSKEQDKRIVRDHYDRGNDFFEAFLGERMVYTSGYFLNADESETLEQSQDNKIDLACAKLQLKPGERLLDIGCGWGTFARRAAQKWGADATGVTISQNQTEYGNKRIRDAGVDKQARVLCVDYRDTPQVQYDKIVSLEMVEHVGVKNLPKYFELVYDRLKDDGVFLIQWTGLRSGGGEGLPVVNLRPEDMIWGLFMNKYIFSGADASLPLSGYMKAMEAAGFEIHSVENVSIHYAITIKRWHDNWMSNKATILSAYGERWYRLWHMFLAWSVRIAEQGSAACFQVVANKNRNKFNRRSYLGQLSLGTEKKIFEDMNKKSPAKKPEVAQA
jgi:cyclopropane fatty-acyl-phospholipid synthase-like methyltransferase